MDHESLLMMKYFIVNYLKNADGATILDIGSARIEGNDQPTETYRYAGIKELEIFKKERSTIGIGSVYGC